MRRATGRDWLLPGAIVLLALALRLWDLRVAPPGLFYDEAANQIDALDVLNGGRLRLFFAGNQGREPLQIYAIAAVTWLLGPGWLAVRLPSVLVGTATVAVAFLLGSDVGGRRVGALGAFLLAVSYWHVSLSRLGFRAVWVPLFGGLALALALRANRTGRSSPTFLSGVALGLGFYTYISARLLPVLVAVAFARRPRALVTAAFGSAVVGLPIGAYFLRHPEDFWTRVQNASRGPVPPPARIWNALGLFFWAGDASARHNLPERPVFDALAGAFFVLGILICLRRWREPRYLSVAAACAVMLLPQALAEGEPHFLRAAGVLPAAQVAAALGLEAALVRLRPPFVAPAVAVLAALWSAHLARDYFVEWAPSHSAYDALQGQARSAAELIAQLPPGEPVAAGGRIYAGRSTFYLGDAHQPALVFDATHAVALAPGGSRLVLPLPTDAPDAIRDRLGVPEVQVGPWLDKGGYAAALFRPPASAFAPSQPLPAVLGGVVRVDGYDLASVVAPGSLQRLVLSWRTLGPAPPGLFQLAHVVGPRLGDNERVWSVDDVEAVPSGYWRGGEHALTWFSLALPPDAPIGALWVETGFYEAASLRRLPAADSNGAPLGDRLLVGPFKVWDQRLAQARPPRPAAIYDGGLMIASVDLPSTAQRGQPIRARVTWWAPGAASTDLTVFAHLLENGQRERAGADGPPASGGNPTSLWQSGEQVVDERMFTLPLDVPQGRYALEYGLYDAATGRRLQLLTAAERLDDAAILGWIDVR